jgi:lincosamide nucleotidyltransferase
LNWLLLGSHVLARGELARALDALAQAHRFLLQAARLATSSTAHWLTPARALERDLPRESYARFVPCTAPLELIALRSAYSQSWRWGAELARDLADRYGSDPRSSTRCDSSSQLLMPRESG